MSTVIEHFVFLVEWAHPWLKCDVKFFFCAKRTNSWHWGETFGLVDLFPTDCVLDFFVLKFSHEVIWPGQYQYNDKNLWELFNHLKVTCGNTGTDHVIDDKKNILVKSSKSFVLHVAQIVWPQTLTSHKCKSWILTFLVWPSGWVTGVLGIL